MSERARVDCRPGTYGKRKRMTNENVERGRESVLCKKRVGRMEGVEKPHI